MTDSIRALENDLYRRIHGGHSSGLLHKGHSIAAATASIPSRYQTVVLSNSDKKGFTSCSRRFPSELNTNVHPGPGTYVGTREFETKGPSFSKKGTGSFASKDKRIARHESSCGPGAGMYNLPSKLQSRKDFNKSTATSVFQKPIANKIPEGTGKYASPAPNQYQISMKKVKKANNVCADAAFKSQSLRDGGHKNDHHEKPAPWQYTLIEDHVRDSVKVPMSSFKSKSERKMQSSPAPHPGPGAYHPHEDVEPVSKTIMPRKHYLCISAPAMALPAPPTAPGPGNYELVDYDGPAKHFMSTSAFVSSTSRWTGEANNPKFPGPAHYKPQETGKQSFLYNAANKWV